MAHLIRTPVDPTRAAYPHSLVTGMTLSGTLRDRLRGGFDSLDQLDQPDQANIQRLPHYGRRVD
jgi:hypothetical protein